MRAYLINPDNPVVSLTKVGRWTKFNRYKVWKPLSLLTLASLTPPAWELEVIDENLARVDYRRLARPDVVGLTAFTSQATRAYEIAAHFKALNVPVVMGGIHASMCPDEALSHVDAIVTGEGESVWPEVLRDVEAGSLQRMYAGGFTPPKDIPAARHDLLAGEYFVGAIQVTRGCPLRCNFCSVTAFNGGKFRHRPIEQVMAELETIKEHIILFVDDNLIGTRSDHIAYSKSLFREMIRRGLTTAWTAQVTINFADDEELLQLARDAGCVSVFIGFESPTPEGLAAVHKRFNIQNGRHIPTAVSRIQQHGIVVVGSFIMGIDTDRPGIGETLALACEQYGIDVASIMILTPLPGTALYAEMKGENRIIADDYPQDWQYYTLSHPVASYKHFTWNELIQEMRTFNELYYSYPKILGRFVRTARNNSRRPSNAVRGLLANLSFRFSHLADRKVYRERERRSQISRLSAS